MPGGYTRRHCLRSGLAALFCLAAAPVAQSDGDRRLYGTWRFSRGSGGETLTTLLTLEPDGTFAAVTAGTAGYAMTAAGTYAAADGLFLMTVTERNPSRDGSGRRLRPETPRVARYDFLGGGRLLIRGGGGALVLERIR